ncbi:MAG: type II toxin-antitoxin system HipA family toxin, partial [Bacteroidota bacterium]|nr:type II toxin-antitoxin system HipA family toxin [Bacteroidota bacterium]
GTALKLNISENDNALSLELAMEVHEYFHLDTAKAKQIIDVVKSSVKNWKNIAQKYGISRVEQELKAKAFS